MQSIFFCRHCKAVRKKNKADRFFFRVCVTITFFLYRVTINDEMYKP